MADGAAPLDFPIEGESRWVYVMRALAFSTLGAVAVIGAVFHFLAGQDSFVETQQIAMILSGIVFLLVFEYFVFLKIVIPGQADYGRYVIYPHKVEFYPLTAMGLGNGTRGETETMGKFMGITTGPVTDRKGRLSYAVYLVHSTKKGRTIKLANFPETARAEKYAAELGEVMNINVVPRLAGRRRRPL